MENRNSLGLGPGEALKFETEYRGDQRKMEDLAKEIKEIPIPILKEAVNFLEGLKARLAALLGRKEK